MLCNIMVDLEPVDADEPLTKALKTDGCLKSLLNESKLDEG